jgi:hypothetical protein
MLQALPVNRDGLVDIGQKDLPVFGAVEDPVFNNKLPKAVRVVQQELQIGLDTHRLPCHQCKDRAAVSVCSRNKVCRPADEICATLIVTFP